jgi:hypothetical protein
MSVPTPPRPDPNAPSEPQAVSQTPAPPPPATTTNTIRNLVIGMVVLVVVALAWANFGSLGGGAKCSSANSSALDTIASGAQHKYEPMTLTDGQAIDSPITFATGEQQDGMLVAATTPAGTGVWIMDLESYNGSGSGLVFAVNDVAKSTTIWGRDTNFEPAEPSDAAAVEACVIG